MNDCCVDSSWTLSKYFKKLMNYDRLFFILTMNNIHGLPLNIKSHIDYIFLFKEDDLIERKKIYGNFLQNLFTFNEFESIMNGIQYDNESIVIDKYGNSYYYEE
jgi:hypothetical protein